MRTAEYVKDVTDTPKILVAEDSRLLADERATEKFSMTAEYFVRKIDAGKMKSYEPYLASKFNITTFVAQPDEHRLLAINPTLKTAILSNGVDTEEYSFSEGGRENGILFSGHLGIYHNRMMAERILKNIFPKIHARSPQTKLYIVGKDPDAALSALVQATPGAELHGNVPDMKPYYKKASVFIHPQEVGAGIQNKLLECMAMGVPVVTSAVGASGIQGIIDRMHVLVSETDEEFVEAALALLAHEEECRRLAANARKLIEQRYTWNVIFDSFDKIISQVTSNFFILPKRVPQGVLHTNGSH